ncbi:MAG TPA: hypothetical protein VLV49_16595 [Terriglobales bacterium]|nr:hypothetical protein [Terriglobales bacterium]
MEVLAACHVHSNWSYDGKWTLEALSEKFAERGCRVLMMTEHDRGFSRERLREFRQACARVSSEKILLLPGIEYSDAANRVHVLVWGPVPFLGESLPTGEMLRAAAEAGGLAVLAHPTRKEAWKAFEPGWEGHLLGIEAWNRKYDGWAPSDTASALLRRSHAVPFVGLDFHTHRQFFPLTMALDIHSPLTEQSVLDCLQSRRCRARVFGVSLGQNLIRRALPALGVAEQGRRKAASLVRYSKTLTR